ncbi:MAG: hypothetical protein V1492_01705 [Candidatus Micrarchaeota archaeon]
MIGFLNVLSGKDKADAGAFREEFAKAKNDLEIVTLLTRTDFGRKQEDAVTAAVKLREALSSGVELSTSEKIEVVKLVNQVKVKSVALGTDDSYKTFHILDSVSEDIRKYL